MIPRSFKEEGQQILKLIDNENGTYDLIDKESRRVRTKRSYQRWILSDSLQGAVMNKRQTRRKLYGKESQYRRI